MARQFTGEELTELVRHLNGREVQKLMRRVYRREAKKFREIAAGHLRTSGLSVKGSTSDWDKGIRARVYPEGKGHGFMITVKAHRATTKQMAAGNPGKSMHKNRRGFWKPVLMWAEDGTTGRQRGGKKVRFKKGIYGTHRGSKVRYYTQTLHFHGIDTGRMRAYGFLDRAIPEMYRELEKDLPPDILASAERIARKYGFV